VRWTIGDVSQEGFDALRLSVWGMRKLFGDEADYVLCVNSLSVYDARRKTGDLPSGITWLESTEEDAPAFLRDHVYEGMAEGVAWKFAPLRFFPDRHELALEHQEVRRCSLFTQSALSIGNSQIPIGAYSMYVIPRKENWTLVVNKNVEKGGKYDEHLDLSRVEMQIAQTSSSVSSLDTWRRSSAICKSTLAKSELGQSLVRSLCRPVG
jgi:hypothetical protein